jgi:hypothetical protein
VCNRGCQGNSTEKTGQFIRVKKNTACKMGKYARMVKTKRKVRQNVTLLTLCNPIFLPTAYSPALICFGRERGWWIICNYPTVLKEENIEKQKEYNLRYLLAKVRTT